MWYRKWMRSCRMNFYNTLKIPCFEGLGDARKSYPHSFHQQKKNKRRHPLTAKNWLILSTWSHHHFIGLLGREKKLIRSNSKMKLLARHPVQECKIIRYRIWSRLCIFLFLIGCALHAIHPCSPLRALKKDRYNATLQITLDEKSK